MTAPLSDDEFVSRLRTTALDAAGSSGLDLDRVLRSSRRKQSTRRAGYVAAAGLVLSTAGFGVAGAIPGVPGVWGDGPVRVEPSAGGDPTVAPVEVSAPPTPTTPGPADLPAPSETAEGAVVTTAGPGVRQVSQPVTARVDADTVVVDLGLGAWGGDRRFLAVVELTTRDGRTAWAGLRIVAGTDRDLSILADGGEAGTVLWNGATNSATIRRADGAASLVAGFTRPDQGGSTHLLLDEPLVAGDPSTTSVEIAPFDLLGDGTVGLRVAEVRSTAEPRGFVHATDRTWGASWCRTTSSDCAVVYDPDRDAVTKSVKEDASALVTELGRTMAAAGERPVVAAMEDCVAQRTGAAWHAADDLSVRSLGTTPQDVDEGPWRSCLLDLSEAADALSQGLIDVPGKGSGSGAASDAPDESGPSDSPGPVEAVTEGLGGLLGFVLGTDGGGSESGGDAGGSGGAGSGGAGAEDDTEDLLGGKVFDPFGDSGG